MSGSAGEVQKAWLSVYASYVRQRVAALASQVSGVGSNPPRLEEAIAQGQAWLDQTLAELLATPFAEQRRGPLEIFQEAMRFPTYALAEAGWPAVPRDEVVANALPGDIYGLAPANSQDLGEEAWQAHLAWGMAKAQAVRPLTGRVGILSRNLFDVSKLEAALRQADLEPVSLDGASLPQDLVAVLVDLEHPAARQVIEMSAGVGCAGYGPHVDRDRLAQARAWGAAPVVARSLALRDPADLIRQARRALQSS